MRKVLFIFCELNDSDIDWMTAYGKREEVAQNANLIQEGTSMGDKLYIVLEGEFKVTVAKNRESEIARLAVGEVIGEMSFIEDRPPSATVTALSKSLVLAIPKPLLVAKLEEDKEFAARFYKALAVFLSFRLRRTVSHLGYGKDQPPEEEMGNPDELDTNILDNLHLAGARFDRMYKRLMGSRLGLD